MSPSILTSVPAACAVNPRQVRAAVSSGRLPEYAEMLAAYHRAFAAELQTMLFDAWPAAARQVLDLACGDGAYSAWLADIAPANATVWAIDVSPDWLRVATHSAARAGAGGQVVALAGDALRLPFANESLDFVWCAQSLYSLPDTVAVLRELHRVLRPGGRLAVLEDDSLHQVLLPWNAELELKVRQAEWTAHRDARRSADRYYVGRELGRLFAEAGFCSWSKRTYAMNRQGPLAGDERVFLELYLQTLRDDTEAFLDRRDRAALERFITPGSPGCVLDDPHAAVTFLDHVVSAAR